MTLKETHGAHAQSAACLNLQARELAQSQEAAQRERNPDALKAAMRKLWPVVSDFRRGRLLFWAWVATLEGTQDTQKEPV